MTLFESVIQWGMARYYDWKPVVKSIIKHCVEHGCNLFGAVDGEGEEIKTEDWDEAAEHVCSCDEGHLIFGGVDNIRKWVWCVLGNEPWETVADHSLDEYIDRGTTAFSEAWENRNCPRVGEITVDNATEELEYVVEALVSGDCYLGESEQVALKERIEKFLNQKPLPV